VWKGIKHLPEEGPIAYIDNESSPFRLQRTWSLVDSHTTTEM